MSEKRYTFECDGNNCQIFENNVWLKIEEVVDLLNTLHQENQILETYCKVQNESKEYWRNKAKRLEEENEQLRKELDTFKPVMFQDVRKGTVILYSKGDSNE